jgi:hypothetical protein
LIPSAISTRIEAPNGTAPPNAAADSGEVDAGFASQLEALFGAAGIATESARGSGDMQVEHGTVDADAGAARGDGEALGDADPDELRAAELAAALLAPLIESALDPRSASATPLAPTQVPGDRAAEAAAIPSLRDVRAPAGAEEAVAAPSAGASTAADAVAALAGDAAPADAVDAPEGRLAPNTRPARAVASEASTEIARPVAPTASAASAPGAEAAFEPAARAAGASAERAADPDDRAGSRSHERSPRLPSELAAGAADAAATASPALASPGSELGATTGDADLDRATAALASASSPAAAGEARSAALLLTHHAPPTNAAHAQVERAAGSEGARVPPDALPLHVEWLAERGGGTAVVDLHPPHLGRVEIAVRVVGDEVEVSIASQDRQVQGVIDSQRGQLEQSLSERSFRMTHFDLGLTGQGQRGNPGSSRDPNAGAREPRSGGVRGDAQTAPISATSAPRPSAASRRAATGIDLHA